MQGKTPCSGLFCAHWRQVLQLAGTSSPGGRALLRWAGAGKEQTSGCFCGGPAVLAIPATQRLLTEPAGGFFFHTGTPSPLLLCLKLFSWITSALLAFDGEDYWCLRPGRHLWSKRHGVENWRKMLLKSSRAFLLAPPSCSCFSRRGDVVTSCSCTFGLWASPGMVCAEVTQSRSSWFNASVAAPGMLHADRAAGAPLTRTPCPCHCCVPTHLHCLIQSILDLYFELFEASIL